MNLLELDLLKLQDVLQLFPWGKPKWDTFTRTEQIWIEYNDTLSQLGEDTRIKEVRVIPKGAGYVLEINENWKQEAELGRIKRGIFRSDKGILINADVQRALNDIIFWRWKLIWFMEIIDLREQYKIKNL
jgi:hypothetical protein